MTDPADGIDPADDGGENGGGEDPDYGEIVPVTSTFVRGRNVLMLRGNFTTIYIDHYLHLAAHGLRYPEELDARLKELLAFLSLHAAARPWAETIAWTANLRAPRANLFATASSLGRQVVGRVFTEDVREPPHDLLHSQTMTAGKGEPRTSTVQLDLPSPREWMETYYLASEQRPCRCFDLGDENYALLAAQPDADLEWLEGLDAERVAAIAEDEQTKLLETREFRHHCGCSIERVLPVLGSWRDRPDELFGDQDQITIDCPRCAARFVVTRDML